MSARYFVDTNLLVYAHDIASGAKHEKARSLIKQLWHDRSGVVSTQVLQELYVSLRRKARKPLSSEDARALVADYLRWEVVVNTGDSILEAIELESRWKLSFWDALVVHAARSSGTEVLYSEDMAHDQVYDTVRVVNPFRI